MKAACQRAGSGEHSVLAEGLRKSYGEKKALDGFDLAVRRGTVLGLLGPNGAGKTTSVRILATLTRPDGGRALVGGFDVSREPREVRRRIGLTGQRPAVDEIMGARQNLEMFGRLLHLGPRRSRTRAAELLEYFGLADVAEKSPATFSGGMLRRLDLAASMILSPDVLFLDEPTTGLDPRGRMEVWEAVRTLAAEGTTVLLTTHYLDEADRLSDRIVLIDHGRAITEDTPAGLKRAVGGDRVEVILHDPADLPAVLKVVSRVSGPAEPQADEAGLRVHAPVSDRVSALTDVARTLQDQDIPVADLGLRRPTLDDVFLRLTGRPAEEPPAEPAAQPRERPAGGRRERPAGESPERWKEAVR